MARFTFRKSTMSQQKSLLQMFPLFLVLFIDGMGLALLFPETFARIH